MRPTLLAILIPLSVAVAAEPLAPAPPPGAAPRNWTVSVQSGYANTFQMTLGGTFGDGPYWTNRVTAAINNLWHDGDSLSAFGWHGLDTPTSTVDWQAGFAYKTRLVHRKAHTLSVTGGIQRWLLPNVKCGAMDWVVAGNLSYATRIKKLPIVVSEDSYSLLRSTLPMGHVLYSNIGTNHTLAHREGVQLVLRHGVYHTYAWGFYGAQGNRVLRYGGSLALTWKNTTFEGGCRQQFALQQRIPNNRFWTFAVTRQFSRIMPRR